MNIRARSTMRADSSPGRLIGALAGYPQNPPLVNPTLLGSRRIAQFISALAYSNAVFTDTHPHARRVDTYSTEFHLTDLSNADLVGVDLGGTDLRGADLSNTDFAYANLRRTLLA